MTNIGSATVTEIDGTSNNVLYGMSIKINPPNAGYIRCNGTYLLDPYVTYESGTELNCQALTNGGFKFSDWSGNLIPSSSNNNNNAITTFKLYVRKYSIRRC